MPRVLLVDDNSQVRRSLLALLEQELPEADFGEAATGEDAVRLAATQAWDVVILDIYMPGQNGLDTLREIKRESPDLPVVMLSMYATAQYIAESLKAGASGYVLKELAPHELLDAVHAALAGKVYVSENLRDLWEGRLEA